MEGGVEDGVEGVVEAVAVAAVEDGVEGTVVVAVEVRGVVYLSELILDNAEKFDKELN